MYERAGTLTLPEDLINVEGVLSAYYDIEPDPSITDQHVSLGTFGHRGSSLDNEFNETHIVAIAAAIVEHRASQGIDGSLFIDRDTHTLSELVWRTALEILTATGVSVKIDSHSSHAPTPAMSAAILDVNGAPQVLRTSGPGLADGTVVTPLHNPPCDGGFKYNPSHGGPADTDATGWIVNRVNKIFEEGWRKIPCIIDAPLFEDEYLEKFDYLIYYVDQLDQVIGIDAIRETEVRIGISPLGGTSVDYWAATAERYGLGLTVVNPAVDPAWPFVTLDQDGRIRMDYPSPNAMASLRCAMTLDENGNTPCDIATGNDTDPDRHGIVTPDGPMNPNRYLAVTIGYLFQHRPGWRDDAAVDKTLISSVLTNHVIASMGRKLIEVPVGFKYLVPGLLDGSVGFGGEESAGASLLRKDDTVWSADKGGIIFALLTSEIPAVIDKTPSRLYAGLVERFSASVCAYIDAPANREQKAKPAALSPGDVTATELAGELITTRLVHIPGNDAAIGGLKVTTENVWFATHPLGTEDVYETYVEPFKGAEHLAEVQEGTKKVVSDALD